MNGLSQSLHLMSDPTYIIRAGELSFVGSLHSIARDGCIQVTTKAARCISNVWNTILFYPDGKPVYKGGKVDVLLVTPSSLAEFRELAQLATEDEDEKLLPKKERPNFETLGKMKKQEEARANYKPPVKPATDESMEFAILGDLEKQRQQMKPAAPVRAYKDDDGYGYEPDDED